MAETDDLSVIMMGRSKVQPRCARLHGMWDDDCQIDQTRVYVLR